jgi:hypothetical protein
VTLRGITVVVIGRAQSVRLLGARRNPDGWWSAQEVRNLVMDLGDRVTRRGSWSEIGLAGSSCPSMPSWPRWASRWSGFLSLPVGELFR